MTRANLKPFAAGVALSAVAFIAGWIIQQARTATGSFVLEYRRPTGPDPWPKHISKDPARNVEDVNSYATFIASRCRLSAWDLTTNTNSTDVDEAAWLRIPIDTVSDANFNCITSFVSPPYVRLFRESQK